MSKCIVFGSLNMDLSTLCKRIPAAGETIDGLEFITNPGGKGANQAVAASRLGADVSLIGAVGEDEFGAILSNCMEDAGVGCQYLKHCTECPTGTAVIIREGNQNRIILSHGANYDIKPEEVIECIDSLEQSGDIFLTQFENDFEATKIGLKHAHDKGLFTMVNPAPAKRIPEEMWETLDFLCMNETESEIITGIYPDTLEKAVEAAEYVAQKGVPEVVITLGSEGAFGRQGDTEYFVPAIEVDAVDTTAAGDTFIGAMIAARASGKSFEEAMNFASAASALTVSRKGAQQSIPNLAEVEEFMITETDEKV